ncbi:hypothetical protein F8388_022546 [Cannabis sativa]|uniref:RNA polymerase I-specific transcription initiation factor RRN3 n=1 Tax=Cannabis sativa TaxID=3483 RepID=A0A7J6EM57_CANSA|nr:hypothetical protein F8388_022546 [Cannabis sativa]
MGIEIRNDNVGYRELNNVDITDSDLFYHVRDALTSVSKGDSDKYNQLVAVMHHRGRLAPDEVALLVTSLKALSVAVSHIDNVLHHSLLVSIFSMNMWSCRIDVMDALIELIISLAASSGKYVDSCLEMLVGNFTPPSSMIEFLKQPRGISIKYQVLSRVHSSLEVLADLVPISPMRLLPIVIQRKPHYTSKEAVSCPENMLKLESCIFGELVRSTMISGLIDLLVDLDVEIGWDDILHDDSTKGIFNMELEDIDEASDDELMDSSEMIHDVYGAYRWQLSLWLWLNCFVATHLLRSLFMERLPRELSRKGLVGNLFAEKLDNLMVVVFEHLNSCEEGGRLNEVFGNLLQSFQKTVLTAYKSKFSQFIMFYACALDPENCGSRFTKMLLDIFVCNTHPPILREEQFDTEFMMSAVAYLASYLSRGKFLSTSSIAKTLKSLVQWCLDYCNSHEGEINPKAHRIFYSGCQIYSINNINDVRVAKLRTLAIMYVLCFRMRSLVGVPWFKSQLLVPINLILSHNLSPLKVCLPSIVTEFLRQSKAADLFTSSEKFNFDEYLESESEFSKAFGGMERLDMFFPFDPCLLKRSDSFIRPNYVYWSMVRPTYNDEEEDSSDEEVEVNTEIEGNHEDFDIDEFDNALNQMSITPKNRFAGGFNEHLRMPSRIRPSTSPESLSLFSVLGLVLIN